MKISKQIHSFFWILPFLSFFLGYLCLQLFVLDTYVQTPHLVGKDIYEATKICSQNKLNLRIIAEKEFSDLKPGTIVKQKPQANKPIKSSQSIFIVTTKIPEAIVAPDLFKKNSREIEKMCEKLKIKNRVYPIEIDFPTDQCFGQIPAPQQELISKKISSYISQGNTKPYLFPDLIGYPVEEITAFLDRNKISYDVFYKRNKITKPFSKDLAISHHKPISGSFVHLNEKLHVHLQVD